MATLHTSGSFFSLSSMAQQVLRKLNASKDLKRRKELLWHDLYEDQKIEILKDRSDFYEEGALRRKTRLNWTNARTLLTKLAKDNLEATPD